MVPPWMKPEQATVLWAPTKVRCGGRVRFCEGEVCQQPWDQVNGDIKYCRERDRERIREIHCRVCEAIYRRGDSLG